MPHKPWAPCIWTWRHDSVHSRIRLIHSTKVGVKLGDYQFEKAKDWRERPAALVVLAWSRAWPHVLPVWPRIISSDEIEEVGIRDGANHLY